MRGSDPNSTSAKTLEFTRERIQRLIRGWRLLHKVDYMLG